MFLGIDIGKSTFHAALIRAEQSEQDERKLKVRAFRNSPAGFAELLARLHDLNSTRVHACIEATGTYGEPLALFLHEAGHRVSLVNPAAVHHFALCQLSRTKTDPVDARTIARFCQLQQPPTWTPSPAEVRELQALVRRLDTLLSMRTEESNRQEALESVASAAAVRASLAEHIAFLDQQIEQTKQQIQEHISSHAALQEKRNLLTSIPGIAEATAARILAELPDVAQFTSSRQVAAFAGLVPKIRQSGTSVRGRASLSKAGSQRLRKALYFPAVVAMTRNPLIRPLRERLLAQGKSRMLIIGAAMRKLLILAYGVLKSGKPFDPEHASVQSPLAKLSFHCG